jgi:hypothetical protein
MFSIQLQILIIPVVSSNFYIYQKFEEIAQEIIIYFEENTGTIWI